MAQKKVISIRWSDKNIRFFTAMGFIDKRNGKVLQRNFSFNKFINNLVTDSFMKHCHPLRDNVDMVKFQKTVKALLIDSLDIERKKIEKKMKEVAEA